MDFFYRLMTIPMLAWLLGLLATQLSYAHLMVEQQGTLKGVDDGVFMVLSLPISAFEGIDDDQRKHVFELTPMASEKVVFPTPLFSP